MVTYSSQSAKTCSAESGFILVLAMVMLLLLSSIGIWALRTSTSELQVAGGSQQIETQFNITEGGAYAECLKVGRILRTFYRITNPNLQPQMLIPLTEASFDPGGDTATPPATILGYKNNPALGAPPVDIWPWENLQPDYADNNLDYRYLVTYLNVGNPGPGFGPNIRAYTYRIQSSAARLPLTVEVGGRRFGI